MKISRICADISIISFKNQDCIFEFKGSPALLNFHKNVCTLFLESYTFDKNGTIVISHNDQGTNYTNVHDMANYKHLAHTCFPDWDFANPEYDKICREMQFLGNVPYEYDKLYWSGTAHSSIRKLFMNIQNDRIMSRDLFDIFKTHMSESNVKKLNLREEQTKYRYVIDIPAGIEEEEAISPRIKFILHSKRLLFFVERNLYDWISCKMEPFVHYIPVKDDFSDLLDKIEWADTHQVEVEKIIENAFTLAPLKVDAINQIKLLLN